jgi:D-alanyl-D-alanine carboxypeptidase
LLDYGFQNYSLKKVSNAGQLVKTVIVDGAAGDDNILELVTEAGFEAVLPVGSDSQDIETRVEIDSEIAAPVQKGKVLGYIEYMNSGTVLGKVNIVAARQVLKSAEETLGITSALAEEQEPPYSYAILAVLLALCAFVIIRSVLKKISRNIKKKKYEQEVYRSR